MVKPTGPTNPMLIKVIRELKRTSVKQKVNIWKRVAQDLEKPTRQRREVNLITLNKYTKPKETVIIPGKVLSDGELDHEVTVAAWKFSEGAKKKLKNAITIPELLKKNPKGKDVRIIG